MTHIDNELGKIKSEISRMWELVISQMNKAKDAFIKFDKDIAREINNTEKRINAFELHIDRDCEDILATNNPVAIDLRFILAVLKINNNLERIGDIAKGIANLIINASKPFDNELVDNTQALIMFEEAIGMMTDLYTAYENENTQLARLAFKRDEVLNEINLSSKHQILDFLKKHPEKTEQGLDIRGIIIKLERVGDQCTNIAEEIIFYLEAKVLKHLEKNQKRS